MPKFFGLFSKRGLTTFLGSCFLATEGAGATFFPLAFFPLGWQDGEKKERNVSDKSEVSSLEVSWITRKEASGVLIWFNTPDTN